MIEANDLKNLGNSLYRTPNYVDQKQFKLLLKRKIIEDLRIFLEGEDDRGALDEPGEVDISIKFKIVSNKNKGGKMEYFIE